MKLIKDGHLVETSDTTEQVNLKARGYAVVKETTAPLAESEKAQLKDDIDKLIEVAKAVNTKNTDKKEKSND